LLFFTIISIVDAFDAMTNDRPYRKAISTEEAIGELKRGAGLQFDPNLVTKFLEMIKNYPNKQRSN
jgi:HD-GYP domain-containing protein (c-di-GMP phosphodiesterase class II)